MSTTYNRDVVGSALQEPDLWRGLLGVTASELGYPGGWDAALHDARGDGLDTVCSFVFERLALVKS